jgi:ABC-type transport system substrate-binding protein
MSSPQGTTNSVDPRNDVKPFNDIRVREAMQMAIDLPTIAKTYYGGAANPNPASITSPNQGAGWGWPYAEWPQALKDEYAYNPTSAKQLLTAAGYPNGFNTNIVAANNCDLGLLQIVQSYFAAVGISMSITTMDPGSWSAYVMVNKKQDQMAIRMQGSLGLTVDPFHEIQRFRVGYNPNFAMVNDPVYNDFYTKAMAATSVAEVQQTLKDANKYVAEHHFVISLLTPDTFEVYQPWLKGFSGQWNSVIQGSIPGMPSLLLFQCGARFWIDQNLKKSMGY